MCKNTCEYWLLEREAGRASSTLTITMVFRLVGSGLLENDMVNSKKKEWQYQEESMVIIVLTCPYCESKNVVRNGHAPNGKQKYLCKDCQRQTRENPTARGYSEEEKEKILKAYEERS